MAVRILAAGAFLSIFVSFEAQVPGPESGGDGWVGEGKNETTWQTRDKWGAASHNPAPEERRRLQVDWSIPTIAASSFPFASRRLTVKGTVYVRSEDRKARVPIDWFQGVRVVIGKTSRARPDWTQRHDRDDSVWRDGVTNKDGTFEIQFHAFELKRPVGGTDTFQVGLVLGTKTGKTVTWRNTEPVLPQSISFLEFPGPKALSPTQQLINGAPGMSSKYDPVALVRAVNHLRELGKSNAIKELEDFVRIANGLLEGSFIRDPADIDTSDVTCVFLIVRVLFEPANAGEKVPPILVFPFCPEPRKSDTNKWPLFPVAIHSDLPFLIAEWCGGIGGLPDQPANHLEWAKTHGKLRAKPLRPVDDPLAAADALTALPEYSRLGFTRARRPGDRPYRKRPRMPTGKALPRDEAIQAIRHLIRDANVPESFKPDHYMKGFDPDKAWEKIKEDAAPIRIRWDNEKQTYVKQ